LNASFVKLIARIAIATGVILVVAVAAFFSAGGMQVIRVLRGPDLPAAAADATPSADIAYLREAVLRNEHGAAPEQYARFLSVLDKAPSPRTIDEFTLIAWRALAQFENAHTCLSRPLARRLPIRLHWVADGRPRKCWRGFRNWRAAVRRAGAVIAPPISSPHPLRWRFLARRPPTAPWC
jgi:hypothetical protein